MARSDKFYETFLDVEQQFLNGLAVEAAALSDGSYSRYVYRNVLFSAGRTRRTEDVARIERLERKMTALAGKLGLTSSSGIRALRFVEDFRAAYLDAGISWWKGQNKTEGKKLNDKIKALTCRTGSQA